LTLHTYEWGSGDGPAVLCLHGVTGHGARYAQLAQRLPGRRVVGIDLLGHGHSSWAPPWDLDAHLDGLIEAAAALGVDRASWIGHSFGGKLVAELVARNPERVTAAVLLDPALYLEPGTVGPRAEGLCADISFASPEAAIEARLTDGSLFSTPREVLEQEAADHLVQREDGRWDWRFSRPAAIGAWSIMSRRGPGVPTSVPALVVFGSESWIPPVPTPRVATIRIATVPGGHSVLWDSFDETAATIAAFLDEVAPA